MGMGYCSTPNEVMYHGVDYQNTKAIQGLIRFYYELKAGNLFKPNFELTAILADVSSAIAKCKLSESQGRILCMYMTGFTEVEISKHTDKSQQSVSRQIKRICLEISNILCNKTNGGSNGQTEK